MIEYFEGNERMHQIISYKGMLFLSGQAFPSAESIEEQTVGVLNKIDRLLADHGSSKDYILSVHIFLRDMALFARFNRIYDEWVSKTNQPTRCCVEARMATEKHLVELVVTAVQKDFANK